MSIDYSEIIRGFKDRLRHPVIAGFLISWLGFNWKFLLFMINARVDIETKFLIADDKYLSWWSGLVLPLLVSSALIVILPYLSVWLSRLSDKARDADKKRKIQSDIDLVEKKRELAIATAGLSEFETLKEKLNHAEQLNFDYYTVLKKVQNEIEKERGFLECVAKLSSATRALSEVRFTDHRARAAMEGFLDSRFSEVSEFLALFEAAQSSDDYRAKLELFVERNPNLVKDLSNYKIISETELTLPWRWKLDPSIIDALTEVMRRKVQERIAALTNTGISSWIDASNN